jgi:translation initiation factor 1
MVEICSTCGLPKDICVCGEISREQQKITVRTETRKFRKSMTIVDGIEIKGSDLKKLSKKMKNFCACGGTAKEGKVLLQGDQREKVHKFLLDMGYPEENIEVQ